MRFKVMCSRYVSSGGRGMEEICTVSPILVTALDEERARKVLRQLRASVAIGKAGGWPYACAMVANFRPQVGDTYSLVLMEEEGADDPELQQRVAAEEAAAAVRLRAELEESERRRRASGVVYRMASSTGME